MALIELRRRIFPNPPGLSAPYTAQVIYWDTTARKTYASQMDSQANNPAELPKDALVDTFAVSPTKSLDVFYNGNGSVYTKPSPANGGAPSQLAPLLPLAPHYTSGPGQADAVLDFTGQLGVPPYQLSVQGLSAGTGGYQQSAVSVSELFPVRFYNLAAGLYLLTVTDALGASAFANVQIADGGGYGRAALIYEEAFSNITTTFQWSYNARTVVRYTYGGKSPGGFYIAPRGLLLDGYLLGNGLWRRVYSAGVNVNGGTNPQTLVYFEDVPTAEDSYLRLHNYSPFHPDSAQEQNGGLVLEMDASHPPLTFALTGTSAAGPVSQTNSLGLFDGLAAGSYQLLVTDRLGKTFTMSVELRVRYGKRWVLAYSDVAGTPCRLELWTKGYKGFPQDIKGQKEPVVLRTDGLVGADGGQGDLGPVVATTAELALKVEADTFEEMIGKDRFCRADFYYDNRLHFRGFVVPATYDAPLLAGLQHVNLTATDGLAGLKDVYMTGHIGQRLYGRRNWLLTLLHCLARTDVALPLRFYTNRREASMATTDAPELLATTDRTGYWKPDGDDPLRMREVVEGVAQALGGTLMQREGGWEVRSILEVAYDHAGRAYRPAGTPAGALAFTAPSATIEPPTVGPVHWLTENGHQIQQVRAGWKSLAGKTDAGWLKNSYPQGAVFSDKYAWLDDASQLRAVSGWRPEAGVVFPLILSRVGEKGKDYSTRWPRSTNSNALDYRYLQGPPLPLATGSEAVPATLQLTGRFVPDEYYLDNQGKQYPAPTNAPKCVLCYELVIGGRPTGVQLAEFELADSATEKESVVSIPLKSLPSAAAGAEIRVYAWYAADTLLFTNAPVLVGLQNYQRGDVVKHDFGNGDVRLYVVNYDVLTLGDPNGPEFTQLTATDTGLGTLYLSSVGVQLTPQNATWEGEDNFRADGPGGDIRPADALEVLHPDVPLAAGLRGGNLPAFVRGVALADGTISTSWRRDIDLDAAPLFEANVYDGLQLRDGASRLLIGTLSHRGTAPPLLLDSLDAPFDVVGKRFAVCASAWNTKKARTEVSLVQNGTGASATTPYNFSGKVLVTDQLYQWLPGQFVPYALGDSDGNLLSWD